MGYILTAYAVNLHSVSSAINGGDQQLAMSIVQMFNDEFDQFDEMAADYCDDDEDALTMEDALTQMVMGEPFDDDLGFMYGYALEFMCQYFGEGLTNEFWSAMPRATAWASTVDEGLNAMGVPENVFRVLDHLMFRGAPVTIPEIDDLPTIGYLDSNEVRAAHAAISKATFAAIKDAEVIESIEEIQTWLQTCIDSGVDLICFNA